MFNLFTVVNVFWGNKIIKSIFKHTVGRAKGFSTNTISQKRQNCVYSTQTNTLRSVLPEQLFQAICLNYERALLE